jgi:hypothetical protein
VLLLSVFASAPKRRRQRPDRGQLGSRSGTSSISTRWRGRGGNHPLRWGGGKRSAARGTRAGLEATPDIYRASPDSRLRCWEWMAGSTLWRASGTKANEPHCKKLHSNIREGAVLGLGGLCGGRWIICHFPLPKDNAHDTDDLVKIMKR